MNIDKYIKNGVIFESIVDVIIDDTVTIGKGTVIKSGSHILGNTIIKENCIIDIGSIIDNSTIENNVSVIKSIVKNSIIGQNTTVGPFANIHTNSSIGKSCRVGNFVEIKNATIGNETKMAHLAYIGDADIGNYCNIGCGAIFVNYDGKNKHRSTVGDSVFIGSNSNIIAPVNLCDNAFIAAGTTVTVDLPRDCLCIGRNREIIKENRSKYHKKPVKKYFGTDGIRGKYGEFLTDRIAFLVGNYLGYSSNLGKVVVGRDNRISGDTLSKSIKAGLALAGAQVIDLGIVPTPCVAYTTRLENANYGIVITASHNPYDYNGIKIFNYDGRKLTDIEEIEIEKFIDNDVPYSADNTGSIIDGDEMINNYINHLQGIAPALEGMTVVIDCANGATGNYAQCIFDNLSCNIIATNISSDGMIINKNCGALYPEKCAEYVLNNNANIGFTFDGDGDRMLAVDEKGQVVDGDEIIYIIANYLKEKDALDGNIVVGTTMTNIGIEKSLNDIGIILVRADVGDHYVMEEMCKNNAIIGGEQSGHIIINNLSSTGDGLQAAMMLSKIIKETNKTLAQLKTCTKYPQLSTSIEVKDKKALLSNPAVDDYIQKVKADLGETSRIIVRPSGTEPKVRITVECPTKKETQSTLDMLADFIRSFI